MWSASMLVTTAITGDQVQERGVRFVGLDHDVVARAQLARWRRALFSRPPMTKVGSRPPSASTLATRLVVVVLPCVPAIAMPCFRRISSASIIARGTTGICASRARDHFRVVGLHRGGGDDGVGAGDVGGVVADRTSDAQRRQAAQWRRCRPGRSRETV